MMIQKGHDALSFDDSRRTVARALCPLGYLVEPQAVLDFRAVDGNHEFSHGPHFRRKFVGAEFGNREGYSLIKRLRLDFNIMRDAVRVGKRDPAAIHWGIIACSSFVRS
jgi:hypothetical protein